MRTQTSTKHSTPSEDHPVLVAARRLEALFIQRPFRFVGPACPGGYRMAAQLVIGHATRKVRGIGKSFDDARLKETVASLLMWSKHEQLAPELRTATDRLIESIRTAKLIPAN